MRNPTVMVGILFAALAGLVLVGCTAQSAAPKTYDTAAAIAEAIGCQNPRQETNEMLGEATVCTIGEASFGILSDHEGIDGVLSSITRAQGGAWARVGNFIVTTNDTAAAKTAFTTLGVQAEAMVDQGDNPFGEEGGESPHPEESEAGPVISAGKWTTVSGENTMIDFEVGAESTGKAAKMIKRMERLREGGDGKPVHYLVLNIDNTRGTESARIYQVRIVDADGNQIESLDREQMIDEWAGAYTSDYKYTKGERQYRDGSELTNDLIDLNYAKKSKGYDFVMFEEPIPDQVLTIYVYAHGIFDEAEAFKVGD